MLHEAPEYLPLQVVLRNGDVISQKQFTELVLQQEGIDSLTLLTQSYMTSREDGGSVAKIHDHLLKLADQGTAIHIGIDHNYAHLIAPHSDFPNKLAPLFMNRTELQAEQQKKVDLYQDLARHPHINLVFHGEGELRILPFSKFDHRKILRVRGSRIIDFAVIYGFNIDDTLDHDVDSGIYITDDKSLNWIDTHLSKGPTPPAEKSVFDDFTFVTRETTKKGGKLADKEITELIQGAEKNLLFSGQFIPDGPLLQELIDASNRDVEVVIISNGPSPSRQPVYMFTRAIVEKKLARACRARDNMQFYIPEDPNVFVHTKALIADVDKPSKARAITGTDNMANPMLGYIKTREILVELSNYDHIKNLYEYIKKNVFPSIKRVQF